MVLAAGRGERMRPLTDTHSEAAGAGGRQAADRLSPRSARARRRARRRHQPVVARRRRSARRWATASATACASPTATKGRCRSRPAAASSMRCRCSGRGRSSWSTAISGRDIDFGALALDAERARAAWCWCRIRRNTRAGISGSTATTSSSATTDRFTYSGVGVYRPEFFAGCEPGRFPLAAAAQARHRGSRQPARLSCIAATGAMSGTPERLAALETGYARRCRLAYNGGHVRAQGHSRRAEAVAPAQRREIRYAAGLHGDPRRHQGARRRARPPALGRASRAGCSAKAPSGEGFQAVKASCASTGWPPSAKKPSARTSASAGTPAPPPSC